MKKDIFSQIVTAVSQKTGIKESQIFKKTKSREVVDARQLVYYLCKNRPMSLLLIVKYMGERGYKTNHTVVLYGISSVEAKMKEDKDFKSTAKEIAKTVSLI